MKQLPLNSTYSLSERLELVKQESESLSIKDTNELTRLADYLLDAAIKDEKRNKKILTNNRMVTIHKRESSYEGLANTLEAGEDGIYSMLSTMGKSILLSPKIEITEEDVANTPGLSALRQDIEETQSQIKESTGRKRYLLNRQLIEMRQQQYILKDSWRPTMLGKRNSPLRELRGVDLSENITIDQHGDIHSDCAISLFNPRHVSAILCNYFDLKTAVEGKFNTDLYYLIDSFEKYLNEALDEYPEYGTIIFMKLLGKTNPEIQAALMEEHGIEHSTEYISSLWRNKIPRTIADIAEKDYLVWYYTEVEKGQWKKCTCCGEIKLAHPKFFSKNKTSKDGYYSICKRCRNKGGKKEHKYYYKNKNKKENETKGEDMNG